MIEKIKILFSNKQIIGLRKGITVNHALAPFPSYCEATLNVEGEPMQPSTRYRSVYLCRFTLKLTG